MATSLRPDSLRLRVIALYATVVTVIVALSGPIVCYVFWRTLLLRMDEELERSAVTVSQSLLRVGRGAFHVNLPGETLEYFEHEPYYGIWAPDHTPIGISDPGQVPDRPEQIGSRTHEGRREFVLRTPEGVTVVVGRDLVSVSSAVSSLAVTMAGVGLAATALSVLCGWFLAGRALAPIARINRTAQAMAEGDFAARITVDGTETELEQVALALNSAFDRMNETFEQLRRFTADASHELRTPAATLSAETEWALGRERDADAYRDSLVTCRTAALRINRVVEGLLHLARADAGDAPLARQSVAVNGLVGDVVSLAGPIAARQKIEIRTSVAAIELLADAERLREAISNLVINAIHFNRPGGRVEIEGTSEARAFVLRVRDTGIGIAPEHLAHVCERFYRVDSSRGTRTGAGLGLAITKSIVEQHGGTLHWQSELGRGSEFVVRLPSNPDEQLPQRPTDFNSVPYREQRLGDYWT